MTISTKKPNESRSSKASRNMTILDLYSPLQVGKILRTSTRKKPDIFDVFRPKSAENLNYDISETNVKLDYGPTKINVKSTRAVYTPLSEEAILAKLAKKRTGAYSHGGPPLEHYVEDLWQEQQNMLQERYKRELKQFIIRRKKNDKTQGLGMHTTIQALVGPEWYQELSPKQLWTVDQLKNCILRDTKDRTIINTQENIGCLGLVLRPNHRNVKKALSLCCKCPVEFLLILYQLIDPNRSKYSLNDRLLLSAVVHLTMRETLREMHIRTPSPPAPKKPKTKPSKREKPEKYPSPYLVPYTFKRPPRKYTGIYVNKHVQYPESPYFDYRNEMYFDSEDTEDIFEMDLENLEPEEVEVIEEVRLAQIAYDNIQKHATNKRKLSRPVKKPPLSEFTQHFNGLKKKDAEQELELVLPPLATLPPDSDEDDDAVCECGQIMQDTEENICCEDHFMTPCGECEGECKCRQKLKIFTKCKKCLAKQRKKNLKRIVGGVKITRSENVIPLIEGACLPKDDCDCLQRYNEKLLGVTERNKLQCQQTKYNIGGVVLTRIGPVYHLTTAFIGREIENNDDDLPEAGGDICCVAKKTNANGHKPCTCGGMPKQVETCPRATIRSDNTCGMCKEAEGDSCGDTKKRSENKPCTCGMHNIKDETSNRQVVPCYNCQCGRKPDTCSPTQCPCGGRLQSQTKKVSKHKDDGCCENEITECECEGVCDCKEQSKLYTSPKCPRCLARQKLKYVQKIIGGLKKSRKNKYVPIIEGTRQLEECKCLQTYKEKLIGVAARNKIKCHRSKFIVGGVVLTRKGPVYILSTAFINKPRRNAEDDTCCKFKAKGDEPHDEECICEDCKYKEDSSEEEIIKYSACRCREELDKFLAHKCTCEDCNVEERQRYATHIIAGAKYTEDGTAVNILEGIQEQRCDCLTQYMEKLRRLDDYRKRCEARYQLMSQDYKYSIGGVVWTADGPMYVISGLRPPVECDCAQGMRRKAEEEVHLSQMARMPPTGRIKYQISGVAQTPEGNVYIVSQALPIDDCDCVRLYNTFREAHSACLESYEQYLAQVREEIQEFEAEAAETYKKSEEDIPEETIEGDADEGNYMNFNFDMKEENEVVKEVEETVVDVQEETKPYERAQAAAVTCDCLTKYNSNTSSDMTSSTSSESSESSKKITTTCTCVTPPVSESEEEDSEEELEDTKDSKKGSKKGSNKGDEKDHKKGRKKYVKKHKGGKKVEKKGEGKGGVKVKKTVEDYQSKRFFITEKFPCNEKEQMKMLKTILAGMAEDGFSLAKLPDSYKLPHFKLWMQLRCGKFWTQEDRRYYTNFTKIAYNHSDHCYREPPSPKLDISKAKANQITWRDAAYVRRIVAEKIGMFYRLARQENVETAREYFPLTFSYEFPTPSFRDCFFAYMPSKEEDVLVYRIIKPYDARVNLKKYPCYC